LAHRRRESFRLQRLATRRQVQRSGSPIRRVQSSFEKALAFEMVDDRHHRAGRDRQMVADYLLRLALIAVHGTQHGEVSWFEPDGANDFAELTCGFETEL
jgi:hypothetical protein